VNSEKLDLKMKRIPCTKSVVQEETFKEYKHIHVAVEKIEAPKCKINNWGGLMNRENFLNHDGLFK